MKRPVAILSILGGSLALVAVAVAFVVRGTGGDPEAGQALSLERQIQLEALQEMVPTSLEWWELMPADYVPEPQAYLFAVGPDADEMTSALEETPVVEAFDGQEISIPGYVVPLAGDETMITEFLLVPYFGACIHTPPPPANQIVYVKPKYPLLQEDSWDPVTVVGTLSVQGQTSDFGAASYAMNGALLTPFERPDASAQEAVSASR